MQTLKPHIKKCEEKSNNNKRRERVKEIGIKIVVTTPHYFVNKIYNLSEYRSGFVVDILALFWLLAWPVVWLPQTIQCFWRIGKNEPCSNQIDYSWKYGRWFCLKYFFVPIEHIHGKWLNRRVLKQRNVRIGCCHKCKIVNVRKL